MKQQFTTKGKVKTVNAEMVITINYETKEIKGTNALTHDDFTKNLSLHKIESFVDGKIWETKKDLNSELEVENEVERMKDRLVKHIESLSNLEPRKTFYEKMQELGFN